MRLNGWQRIGVIVSVVWIVVMVLGAPGWFYNHLYNDSWAAMNKCQMIAAAETASQLKADPQNATNIYNNESTEMKFCVEVQSETMAGWDTGKYTVGLFLAIAPVLLAWILAWIGWRAFKWVKVGFNSEA